jgi:hypothetical protein
LKDKVRQHNLPAVQFLPHVITGCLHVWKNIFGVNSLNQKMIPTLLSLPLYIVWARINTKLQLIVYHVNGKSMWTVLVVTFGRGHVSIFRDISSIYRNSEMTFIEWSIFLLKIHSCNQAAISKIG